MSGRGESMPKRGLNASMLKELSDPFERIHGLLLRLRGKTIHEISMNHNPRRRKRMRNSSHLLDRHSFVHQLEQAIRRDFKSSAHGHTARSGQELGKFEIKAFFKPNISPPGNRYF